MKESKIVQIESKTLENIISDRILPNKLPSSLLVPLVAAV